MINFGWRNSGDFIVYWSDRLRRGKRAREPVPAQSEPDLEVHLPQVIGLGVLEAGPVARLIGPRSV